MHGIVVVFLNPLFTHRFSLSILLLYGVDKMELLCITVLSFVTLVFQNRSPETQENCFKAPKSVMTLTRQQIKY